MSTQIIPFESNTLPAHVAKLFAVSDDMSAGVGGGGFPHVSIKGKVFHISRGDEKTLITKGDEGEPAASIDVVIIRANPSISKVYYTGGYTEGSEAKPECYSNDGISPAADAESPQAKKCAVCPHNQWGSRITENGGKGKACGDSRRIAIAPVNMINDPMLIRVPAASLKALAQHSDQLKKRGVAYQAVVTKIGFDYSVAHPALTFKPVGFIDETTAMQVREMMDSDVVNNILGIGNTGAGALGLEKQESYEEPVKTAEPKPVAKPAAKATTFAVEDEPVQKPVQVEQTVEAAPAKQAKKPAVVEVDDFDDMLKDLDSMVLDD